MRGRRRHRFEAAAGLVACGSKASPLLSPMGDWFWLLEVPALTGGDFSFQSLDNTLLLCVAVARICPDIISAPGAHRTTGLNGELWLDRRRRRRLGHQQELKRGVPVDNTEPITQRQ